MRLTLPLILSAVAVSVVALPAIGYVPWDTSVDRHVEPAQIQSIDKADPADKLASDLHPLRAVAQEGLQALTDRNPTVARDRVAELQRSWRAQRTELEASLPGAWEEIDRAIARAAGQINAPQAELFLGKAAMLNVLSAMDVARAQAAARQQAAQPEGARG